MVAGEVVGGGKLVEFRSKVRGTYTEVQDVSIASLWSLWGGCGSVVERSPANRKVGGLIPGPAVPC